MRRYGKPILLAALLLMLGYALWPLMQPHLIQIKAWLIEFKQYSRHQPATSYLIYSGVLMVILLLGLPVATAIILLAGITYGFWEAIMLVTACRLAAAGMGFVFTRHMIDEPRRERYRKKPTLLKKFERNPHIALLLMRLAPLPDSVANYTMGASPIRSSQYLLYSLLGMIPLTILYVWIGNELGSISKLIRFLN